MDIPPDFPAPDRLLRTLARFDPRPTLTARSITWLVATSSKALMQWGNEVVVTGREHLDAARAQGRGLLTFSNHVSLFDDPWLTACLSGPDWPSLRWIAADAHNFFGSRWKAAFFGRGKCVPIVRGVGRDQPGMTFLEDRLREGDWVHIFPEGGRSREEGGALQTPFKAGFAQLVQASSPLVVPFFHTGMHEVLPIGARLPRLGRQVALTVGDATDTAAEMAAWSLEEITAWAESALAALAAEVSEARAGGLASGG